MTSVKELSKKTVLTLKNEGMGAVLKKAKHKICGEQEVHVEYESGILKDECEQILKDFFKDLRLAKEKGKGCDK